MSSIHDVFKDDDVRGVIIGGDYISGRLFYEDRPQGGRVYADSEEELKHILRKRLEDIKLDCGDVYAAIYQKESAWSIRIDVLGTGS